MTTNPNTNPIPIPNGGAENEGPENAGPEFEEPDCTGWKMFCPAYITSCYASTRVHDS